MKKYFREGKYYYVVGNDGWFNFRRKFRAIFKCNAYV